MKKIRSILAAVIILAAVTSSVFAGSFSINKNENLINDELIPLSSGEDKLYAMLDNTLSMDAGRNISTTAGNIQINESLISQGAIGIKFDYSGDKKIKIAISNKNDTVYYNYLTNGSYEVFPLQFGNGSYDISIMENLEGNKYTVLSSSVVELDIPDQNVVFLNSTQTVKWSGGDESSTLALEITKNSKTDTDKVKAIYAYIIDKIDYDYSKIEGIDYTYIPDNNATLDSGKGICYDYAALMASMLRSVGVPVKLVKGYGDFQPETYHAWNEVLVGGEWVTIDTTYDAQLYSDGKKVDMVKESSAYAIVNVY
ncbi:MAG: transglutaminase domain-containing protein [Eubacteriaceae bacterium]|nr:transglutaminase domain-containing protein [Eubacteriaceae bacterium]